MPLIKKSSIAFKKKNRLFYPRTETSTFLEKPFNFRLNRGFLKGIKRYIHNGLLSFLFNRMLTFKYNPNNWREVVMLGEFPSLNVPLRKFPYPRH